MKKRIEKITNFGEMPLKSIITYLFEIGCIIIAYKAFLWGKAIYLSTYYEKEISYIKNNQSWYTTEMTNNLPLGIAGGIVYFIVISVAWKLICELLYIIFERISRK